MVIGRVLGEISLERTLQNTQHLHWVQVDVNGQTTAALDLIGARPQELVLLCASKAASRLVPECPVDAAIIGVVSGAGNCS